MAIYTPDGRISYTVVWVTPRGVLQTGGPHRLRYAVFKGGSGACYQGIAHIPKPVNPGDIQGLGNGPSCGVYPIPTRSGTDVGTSPGVSRSRSAPPGLRDA